ncbi:MAG: PQQ-dependent sugar dehydrogenase [Actinomycetota bacterium]
MTTAPAVAEVPSPEVIVDGLEFPAGIAFTSDGRMLVTERAGRLRLVEDEELIDEPVAEIPTRTAGETGLLGVAVDPDDAAAYLFATEPDGDSNSIWRVPLDDPGSSERVITGLPAATYHNGGGVAFDRDGMLLVSNGEQHSAGRAQDPEELGGKVYRFTPDGDVPDDNPFEGSPALGIGLRNPFGLAVDPVTGDAWVTENGPQSWDEVNRVPAGSNLGWPIVSGPRDGGEDGPGSLGPGDYLDPALAFEQIIIPTGIAFTGQNASPPHQDALFFAAYGDSTIRRAVLDDDRLGIESSDVFLEEDSPVVAMAWGPRGLYYSTTGGAVKVIEMAQEEEEEEPSPDQSVDVDPSPEGDLSGDGAEDGATPGWIALIPLLLIGGYLVMRRRL